jgi:hypothetical protein
MHTIDADNGDIRFGIREAAGRRARRASAPPLPGEVVVHADGSAVVSYEAQERLVRWESIAECLEFHELVGTDLEPRD